MKSFNILFSCSSNKSQTLNWIKNSIKKFNCNIKIYAGDSNNQVISRYFCDVFWHMPKCNNQNYLKILNYCKKNNIKIIIPSSDKELIFWSNFKENLKKNKIFVMVSSKKTIKNCLDKLNFYNVFKKFNSIIFTSQNLNDFKKNEKIVAKQRYGAGNNDNFINFSKKDIHKYLKKKNLKNYVFQKYVRSDKEISIDCFFSNNNKLLKIVPRYRTIINFGESLVTKVFNNKYLFDEIENLGSILNFSGHVMFQCFYKNGNFKIFECNPRIGGGSSISYLNKMDSIYFFIQESLFPKKKIKLSKKIYVNSKLILYKKTKFIR